MKFFVRFLLGLPPTARDIQEAREWLPDLWETIEGDDASASPVIVVNGRRRAQMLTRPGLRRQLQGWLRGNDREVRKERAPNGPAAGCPLHRNECPAQKGDEPPAENEQPFADGDWVPLSLNLLVGGLHGGGSKAFFDLVSKSGRPKKHPIKRVILTDRYLHDSFGEEGTGQGFTHLLRFLSALGLNPESSFSFEVSPAMMGASSEKIEAFQRRLGGHFKAAAIKRHSNKAPFHDRLYIVDDGRSLSGIFGPSLNGLDAQAVYVMGELPYDALRRLGQVLE